MFRPHESLARRATQLHNFVHIVYCAGCLQNLYFPVATLKRLSRDK